MLELCKDHQRVFERETSCIGIKHGKSVPGTIFRAGDGVMKYGSSINIKNH